MEGLCGKGPVYRCHQVSATHVDMSSEEAVEEGGVNSFLGACFASKGQKNGGEQEEVLQEKGQRSSPAVPADFFFPLFYSSQKECRQGGEKKQVFFSTYYQVWMGPEEQVDSRNANSGTFQA